MKVLNNVIYDRQPLKVTVYPTCVYVCDSCEPVTIESKIKDKQNGDEKVISKNAYKCQVTVYEIPEYIDKLQQENEMLNAQTTELQLALCEVYEMML